MSYHADEAEYVVCPYCRTPSPPATGRLTCPSCGAPLPPPPPRRPRPPEPRGPRSGWPLAVFFYLPVGTLASAAFLFLSLAGFGFVTEAAGDAQRYRTAVGMLEAGRYEEAATGFAALGPYKDSRAKYGTAAALAYEVIREEALTAELNGNYRGAAAACERARTFASTPAEIADISLIAARNYYEDGDFRAAGKNFDAASTALTLDEDDRARYDDVRRIREEEQKWELKPLTGEDYYAGQQL